MAKRIEDLTRELEAALGESPAAAGRRLVSEPELAKICGSSRQTLRGALDRLIDAGFVVRRHGSGTYVRKVSGSEALKSLPKPSFEAESIFLKEAEEPAPHEPLPAQRRMALGVTEELSKYNEGNKAMLSGVLERAESLGHLVKLVPELGFDKDGCEAPEGYAEALRDARCDGFIQMANSRRRFLHGLREAYGERQAPPVYYVWPGSWGHEDCHPLINLDTEAAVRMAVSKMARNGRRRIALLSLSHGHWPEQREATELAYGRALEEAGLGFKASACVDEVSNPAQTLAAMEKLWSGAEKPDGLYVADDHFLPAAAKWLAAKSLRPGESLGVVTLSNRGRGLDSSANWSQARFSQEQTGRLAADALLRAIQTAGEELCSLAQRPQWIQGDTH